jgi:hypothetical protein
MDIFPVLAERKIQEAFRQGMFDDLEGRGRPLIFEDETWIPEDLRMACRILKNAHCMPPEIELKKDILNLRDLMMSLDDDAERIRKLRELNYKMMTLNMMRKIPFHLESLPEYGDRIIDKLTGE